MELNNAKRIASDLVESFAPYCVKIIIAGSVRRGKPEVKDIEIVAIPQVIDVALPGFGHPELKSRLDMAISVLIERGVLARVKGAQKFQQYTINTSHWEVETPDPFKLDLFIISDPRAWGAQVVIRTGPAEFSHWCVTKRYQGGALPNGFYMDGGLVVEYDTKIVRPMLFEQDFLNFLGLGWIDPADRKPEWRRFE